MQAQPFAPAHAHPHLQPLQSIEPVHALAIDLPTFATQHDVDALVAKARSIHGDLPNAHAQRRLILRLALLVPARAAQSTQPTRPDAADLILIEDPLRQLPTA